MSITEVFNSYLDGPVSGHELPGGGWALRIRWTSRLRAGSQAGGAGLGIVPASMVGMVALRSLWQDGTYALPTTGSAWLQLGRVELPPLHHPFPVDLFP